MSTMPKSNQLPLCSLPWIRKQPRWAPSRSPISFHCPVTLDSWTAQMSTMPKSNQLPLCSLPWIRKQPRWAPSRSPISFHCPVTLDSWTAQMSTMPKSLTIWQKWARALYCSGWNKFIFDVVWLWRIKSCPDLVGLADGHQPVPDRPGLQLNRYQVSGSKKLSFVASFLYWLKINY